jgi:hypothetical protein
MTQDPIVDPPSHREEIAAYVEAMIVELAQLAWTVGHTALARRLWRVLDPQATDRDP